MRHTDLYRFGTWEKPERLSKNTPAMKWLVGILKGIRNQPQAISQPDSALYILACYCPDNSVLDYMVDTFMYYCKARDIYFRALGYMQL